MSYSYRYQLNFPNYIPRIGNFTTGTFKSSQLLNVKEIEDFAKWMSHGWANSGVLTKYIIRNEKGEVVCQSSTTHVPLN